MKTMLTILSFTLISYTLSAQNISITIENIHQKGDLMVGLYTSDEGFQKNEFLIGQTFKVEENTASVTACFQVPEGTYGVAIFLDINGNGEFDFGMESYGFSNHFIPMGPPVFNNFKFNLKDGYQEKISLK